MTQAWTLSESLIVSWDYGNTCSLKNNSSTIICSKYQNWANLFLASWLPVKFHMSLCFIISYLTQKTKQIIHRQLRSWGSLMSESNSSLIICSKYKNPMNLFLLRWFHGEILYLIVIHRQLFDADLKTIRLVHHKLGLCWSLISENNSSLIIGPRKLLYAMWLS